MAARQPSPRLDRRQVVARLLEDRGELLVVTGPGAPAYDVFAAGDDARNFYLWGALGSAAMVGLGLAMAQPDRQVAVITGDGDLLMGLGGLATIGVLHPANLSIVVLDNERYGETGMQRTHTAHGVDLPAIASGCGFAASRPSSTRPASAVSPACCTTGGDRCWPTSRSPPTPSPAPCRRATAPISRAGSARLYLASPDSVNVTAASELWHDV